MQEGPQAFQKEMLWLFKALARLFQREPSVSYTASASASASDTDTDTDTDTDGVSFGHAKEKEWLDEQRTWRNGFLEGFLWPLFVLDDSEDDARD